MTTRTTLYEFQDETIKVIVEAFFNEAGALVVEGYDIGRKVAEYWGDSDYEYSSTISPEETKKLFVLFNLHDNNRNSLLLEMKKRYNTNTCYSEFQTFREKNSIRYEGFSWR